MKASHRTTAVALLAFAAGSWAQVPAPPPETPAPVPTSPANVTDASPAHVVDAKKVQAGKRRFGKLDVNNNGRLSFEEARAVSLKMSDFRALDTNSDGSLTRDELGGRDE